MRTFLSDWLWNSFESFSVGGDVFQLSDAELEQHVADAAVHAAESRQHEGQRLAGMLTAATWSWIKYLSRTFVRNKF